MLNGFLNMENVKILPYKVPKYQKNVYLEHLRLLHGYNLLACSRRIKSCGHFKGQ